MSVFNNFWAQVKAIVNISDHVDTAAAQRAIRNNIYFHGPNIWILIFSMVIASVGLNVNSIPVVIGAMLISPLMGPIFGIGLGFGVSDLALIKDSLKNLLIMMSISLLASYIYFLVTPLSLSNPTELLARTNPTIYDVIIAFFGGLAGIFEMCRKEKGTVFSGVAIATALMPPLCTAGFGLASGKLIYFLGALYLFTINCIFIILATYIMVKYMRFADVEFESVRRRKQVKTFVTVLLVIFIIPSIWSAVVLIRDNNAQKNGGEDMDQSELVKGIYERSDSEINRRDAKIKELESTISEMQQSGIPYVQITKEIMSQYPAVKEVFISRGANVQGGQEDFSEGAIILLKTSSPLSDHDRSRLNRWLKIRLNTQNVIIYEEHSADAD